MSTFETLSSIMSFVTYGEHHGVPVKFLRQVFSKYTVSFHDGNSGASTDNEKKNIEYPAGLMNLIRRPAFDGSDKEARAVGLLYHEATHAFLHLSLENRNNQAMQIMKSAEKYYAGGTLENGRRITNPQSVADEAMAFYVHWRILSWWKARESITAANMMPVLAGVTRARAWSAYRSAMARRVFGYEIGPDDTVHTDMETPANVRSYCDCHILEGKIPDKFANVA